MFDIFKQDIKVGDKVKLYLTTGKEPEGIVVSIGDNFVLLESSDGTQNRFFDKLIGGWELVIKNNVETEATDQIRLSRICREYEIGLKELVSFLNKKNIRVDINPNAKISNEELDRIKEELSVFANNTNTDLKDFVKLTIINEDKSNPYSDSMLWRMYIQSTGIKVKRKRIVQARKELGYEDHINRYPSLNEKKSELDSINTYNSFDELTELFEKQQYETFISPNAEIDRYFTSFQNGSAKNSEIDRILFKNEVVCDFELLAELKNFKKNDLIPVFCSYSKTGKGAYAYLVFKPCNVKELIHKIESLIDKKEKIKALIKVSHFGKC